MLIGILKKNIPRDRVAVLDLGPIPRCIACRPSGFLEHIAYEARAPAEIALKSIVRSLKMLRKLKSATREAWLT